MLPLALTLDPLLLAAPWLDEREAIGVVEGEEMALPFEVVVAEVVTTAEVDEDTVGADVSVTVVLVLSEVRWRVLTICVSWSSVLATLLVLANASGSL